MNELLRLVVFILDGQRYALLLPAVERVVRAVEVTPLPAAPKIVLGMINVGGRIVPVIDVRKRFHLPEKGMDVNDHLIIARTAKRMVALLADSVSTTVEIQADEVIHSSKILPRMEYVDGVAKLEDGMVLIHDLDKFLSLEEEDALDEVSQG
jgi:purine-binding chemotaxis protein CheW